MSLKKPARKKRAPTLPLREGTHERDPLLSILGGGGSLSPGEMERWQISIGREKSKG